MYTIPLIVGIALWWATLPGPSLAQPQATLAVTPSPPTQSPETRSPLLSPTNHSVTHNNITSEKKSSGSALWMTFLPTIIGGGVLLLAIVIVILILKDTAHYSPVLGVENIVETFSQMNIIIQHEHAGVDVFKGQDDL